MEKYFLPTQIIFGIKALDSLDICLKENFPDGRRVFLVTGRNSMQRLGITRKVKNRLKKYRLEIWAQAEPNPSLETVDRGVKAVRKFKADLVIGLGGGSAIDAAKATSVLAKNPGKCRDYQQEKRRPQKPGIPFMAIPTTAGTASEVTMWSVVTDVQAGRKQSFGYPGMYPRVALLDPELTVSMSPALTVATGLDALCHAVECYFSPRTNAISDLYAVESVRLIREYLPRAYRNGRNLSARTAMLRASLYAGLAFSQTGTSSVHKLSHLFVLNKKIAHGLGCALSLPYFVDYFSSAQKAKAEQLREIFRTVKGASLGQKLKNFMAALKAPVTLAEIGFSSKETEALIKSYDPRQKNDPKKVTKKALSEILKQMQG